MPKRVVLIGHCGADTSYLRIAISAADPSATAVPAHDESSLNKLLNEGVDLILLNRTLDYGFKSEEGVDLVTQLRQSHPHVKTMLISNYPEAQQAAVQAGALPGFGKRELGSARVKQLLRDALSAEAKVAG